MFCIIKHYPVSLMLTMTIWVVCLIPLKENPLPDTRMADKWAHMAMYLVFTLAVWAEDVRQKRRFRWTWLFVMGGILPVVMGGLVELAQAYFTGGQRNGDWLDFWADVIGVALAWLVGLTVWLMTTRRKDEPAATNWRNDGRK